MDDPTFVRVHGFEAHALAETDGLGGELFGKALERLLALLAIVAAVHDDAHIVLAAGVGNGACKHLHGIDDFAASPDDALGRPVQIDDDLFALFGKGDGDIRLQMLKEAVQKLHGAFAVRQLPDGRQLHLCRHKAEQLLLSGIEDLYFHVLSRKAHCRKACLYGFLCRFPLKDLLFLIHTVPLLRDYFLFFFFSVFSSVRAGILR